MVLDEPSRVFVLLSTALVHLMTPGLAFFYGGMVSRTSVLTVLMQSFTSMLFVSLLWFVVGFSLCFGDGGQVYGSPLTFFCLSGVNGNANIQVNGGDVDMISGVTFCVYQLTFAVIAPALITGAFVDRLTLKAFIPFIVLWFFLVYCPFAHMVWGGGWFEQLGAADYAGGTVVHITSGWSGLASPLVLGRRTDAAADVRPHNVPFVALGTAMLWFGWFGFNGGSALSIEGSESCVAYLNTQLCAASAGVCWVSIETLLRGKPTLVGACIGVVVGLVVITPMAGYCQPWAAVVAGPIGAACCYAACEARRRYLGDCFDDALDVWGCHGVGGFVGCVLVGALSDPAECNPGADSGQSTPVWCSDPNTVNRSWAQVATQALTAAVCAAWSFAVTVIVLRVLSLCMVIRIPRGEIQNIDGFELRESAYDGANEVPNSKIIDVISSRSGSDSDMSSDGETSWEREESGRR